MPVPYMGSKRKSADRIYSVIKNHSKGADTIVDLFCGGFAIGEEFIKNGWTVIANDKNKYVVALIKEAINGRFSDKNNPEPEFVSRQHFLDVIKNPNNYDDWYVGYVACIWSFGNNNNKGYLFGKDVEPIKYAGHRLVVNKDPIDIQRLIPQIPQIYIDAIMKLDTWHKRRLALARVSKSLKTRILELEQLQQLQRLELTSGDYRDVVIPENAVVYCDPPYAGTAEYVEGGFNHTDFWEWVRKKSKTNDVYVSEYTAPDDFKVIRSFPQKSTLQGGHQLHNNQPDECIFVLDKDAI